MSTEVPSQRAKGCGVDVQETIAALSTALNKGEKWTLETGIRSDYPS